MSALAPVSRAAPQLPPALPPNPPVLPPATSSAPATPLPQPAQQSNFQQLLNPGTLAGLIKATATSQQPTPPPHTPNIFSQVQQTNVPQLATPASSSENPLISSLRARGLLPTVTPGSSAPGTAPAFSNLPLIIPGQVRYTPPVSSHQASAASGPDVPINVQMSTTSIKMSASSRPLISTF